MSRILRRLAASAFAVLFLLSGAAPALADITPACFCSIANQGATQVDGATTSAGCQTLCQNQPKSEGFRWATDASQYPSSILQCFSGKDQCEKDMDGDGLKDGTFDSKQPAECLPGWHYCYSVDSEKYDLQVSIPSGDSAVTTVSNYGEYIGTAYNYLLGFAFTVAIVFVMIGGIRYVIAGSTGEIGKAKDMIVKAVSGSVLLLFAFVILKTVNPQLVKLQVPRLPMLRHVDILTGGETCEALKEAGYKLDGDSLTAGKYGEASCGSTALVTTRPDGSPAPEGTTCMFSGCHGYSEKGARGTAQCASNGQTAWCLTCNQIVPNNAYGVIPSSGVCSVFDPADTLVGSGPAYDLYNVCGYTHDPTMVSSGIGATTAATATVIAGALSAGTAAGIVAGGYSAVVAADALAGTCAAINVDCKQVADCEGYNNSGLQVYNTITDNELYDLDYPSLGSPSIVTMCNQDPCRAGAKAGTSCAYNESTGDCRAAGYAESTLDPDEYPTGL